MSILDPHPRDSRDVYFDELANALLEQGEQVSPSELHGCLCGLIGGGARNDPSSLLPELEQTLGVQLHGELTEAVEDLYRATMVPLLSGDLDFEPLLPDDDLELEQRVAAMAAWCRGFLAGFAQARVRGGAQSQAVAPDSAEALKDFAAIAQAASDENDGEEAEDHYVELVEYLRVAAMNVLMDAGTDVDPGVDPGDG